MNYKKMIVLFLLLILGLTACAGENGGSANEASDSIPVPTPETGKAIIYGTMLDTNTNQPTKGVPFLAKALIADNPDMPITVSFSYQNDPGAKYDENTGFFVFENIIPGDNYAIIVIFGPGSSTVVNESGTDQPLIISIKSGETLNIGTVKIQE
jgi:hypothetical protein